ncbi:MAG: hypothetical protein ACRDRN_00830 [Sciscionella sp.]
MTGITAVPYSFAVTEPIWRTIVHDTLRAALDKQPPPAADLADWLDTQAVAAATSPLLATFTGVLTSARRPH